MAQKVKLAKFCQKVLVVLVELCCWCSSCCLHWHLWLQSLSKLEDHSAPWLVTWSCVCVVPSIKLLAEELPSAMQQEAQKPSTLFVRPQGAMC